MLNRVFVTPRSEASNPANHVLFIISLISFVFPHPLLFFVIPHIVYGDAESYDLEF